MTPSAPADLGPCKICGGSAPLHLVVDFNRNLEEMHGFHLPLSGIPVYYGRCESCGFLFTRLCDEWNAEEFRARIYNEDYARVDPEHAETRPARIAPIIPRMFFKDLARLSILDWGGGSGAMKRELERFGAARVEAYDPFVPQFSRPPTGLFHLVTCFEVIEHLADPVAAAREMIACLDPQEGAVLHSTAPQPDDQLVRLLMWPYLAPRNGHISLFTHEALRRLWAQLGFHFVPVSDDVYLAFAKPPAFAAHLIKPASTSAARSGIF